MKIIPTTLSRADSYALLTKLVSPRPIAMVVSVSSTGVVNVAPFSYFNLVSIEPPVVMISVQQTSAGQKDTARNVLASTLAVIHVVDETILDDMHATGTTLPANESELSLTSFTTTSQEHFPPFINEARAHMNVRLYKHIEVGKSDVLLLEVVEVLIHERALEGESYGLDFSSLLSRVGSQHYVVGGMVVTKERKQ
jgi:flavin reductase (DIM6/NTAB) family NADH-FMN oxidoreductase RutF